jgi:hypothetical protein
VEVPRKGPVILNVCPGKKSESSTDIHTVVQALGPHPCSEKHPEVPREKRTQRTSTDPVSADSSPHPSPTVNKGEVPLVGRNDVILKEKDFHPWHLQSC